MKWLHKPHPFIFNKSSVGLPGATTFLILAFFAPFGFQEMEFTTRLGSAAFFGLLASFSVLVVVKLLQKIYPSYNDEWTVGKEILLILAVLSTICLLVFLILFSFQMTNLGPADLFKSVILTTVIISFFPVVILVLFEQYNHQKSQWKKATEMNSLLDEKGFSRDSDLIRLLGENGKLELQINPKELIFLKSDGNYVEAIYGDGPEKKLLRNRLKALSDQLPSDLFFHCHKSYVVNKQSIISVEGNARNFELKLRGIPDAIPVSRAKSEELKQFLQA